MKTLFTDFLMVDICMTQLLQACNDVSFVLHTLSHIYMYTHIYETRHDTRNEDKNE